MTDNKPEPRETPEVCAWCGEETLDEPYLLYMQVNRLKLYRLHFKCRRSIIGMLSIADLIWRGDEDIPTRCEECYFYEIHDHTDHCGVNDSYVEDPTKVCKTCPIKITPRAYKHRPTPGFQDDLTKDW